MASGYMPKRTKKPKKWRTGTEIEVGNGKHVHEIPVEDYKELTKKK